MDIKLRLITLLLYITFCSCNYTNKGDMETNSYQTVDLYSTEKYRYYTMYFTQNAETDSNCILAYKIAGDASSSNLKTYLDFFIKSLNPKMYPALENGYILIDNEFKTELSELAYMSQIDSMLKVNYNKKIKVIEVKRNEIIKIFIQSNIEN